MRMNLTSFNYANYLNEYQMQVSSVLGLLEGMRSNSKYTPCKLFIMNNFVMQLDLFMMNIRDVLVLNGEVTWDEFFYFWDKHLSDFYSDVYGSGVIKDSLYDILHITFRLTLRLVKASILHRFRRLEVLEWSFYSFLINHFYFISEIFIFQLFGLYQSKNLSCLALSKGSDLRTGLICELDCDVVGVCFYIPSVMDPLVYLGIVLGVVKNNHVLFGDLPLYIDFKNMVLVDNYSEFESVLTRYDLSNVDITLVNAPFLRLFDSVTSRFRVVDCVEDTYSLCVMG